MIRKLEIYKCSSVCSLFAYLTTKILELFLKDLKFIEVLKFIK